jgi:hypothetical protein
MSYNNFNKHPHIIKKNNIKINYQKKNALIYANQIII